MNQLARIVQTATPSTAVHFRKSVYGRDGAQDFLCDVLAMANAAVDGPRYIITGAEVDHKGKKCFLTLDAADLEADRACQSLANEHIEPPLRLRYDTVTVNGKQIGVLEIGDCHDRPYMMRVDFSETLRRGDAYARVNESVVKLGRRQLQSMFERKFRDSISDANIEIGFAGSIIHQNSRIETCDLSALPSRIAGSKLQELMQSREQVQASLANTAVARLTHARLFGSDSPYRERSCDTIIAEMEQVADQHRDEDEQFLFDQRYSDVQLVVLNQGDEALQDASLTMVMPTHEAFHVASRLPKIRKDGKFISRLPTEQADYPDVTHRDDSIHVAVSLGDIEPGEPRRVFGLPLRVAVDHALKGRRAGIRYKLYARNLRRAATGKLRLLFV